MARAIAAKSGLVREAGLHFQCDKPQYTVSRTEPKLTKIAIGVSYGHAD
jgi:hypothetical protein